MSRSSVQIRPLAPCETVCFGRNGRFFVFSEKLYFRNYQCCPLFVPYCPQKLVPFLNKTESTQHGFFHFRCCVPFLCLFDSQHSFQRVRRCCVRALNGVTIYFCRCGWGGMSQTVSNCGKRNTARDLQGGVCVSQAVNMNRW